MGPHRGEDVEEVARSLLLQLVMEQTHELLLPVNIERGQQRGEERGRDLENVLFQYTNLVKPAFEEFCLPVSIMHILRLTRHLTK